MADDVNSPTPFDEVLRAELEQISKSRQERLKDTRIEEFWVDQQLVGLALSGGGIRSATFSLGVLQGLARAGLLRHVDYFSSTGGGAEITAWLLRWIRARGFREVEKQLSGKESPSIEPAEIQSLRRTIAFPKRRPLSIAALALLRNVTLSLLVLAAFIGAAILVSRILLEQTPMLTRCSLNESLATTIGIAILLVVLRIRKSSLGPPTQLRTFLIAVLLTVFAFSLVMFRLSGVPWRVFCASAMALFCLILGVSWPLTFKTALRHLGASVAAGLAAALLLTPIAFLLPPLEYLDPFNFQTYFFNSYEWMQVAVTLVVMVEALSLLLYAVLLKRSLPRGARELFWRVCRTILGFACISIIVVLTWFVPISMSVTGIVLAVLLTAAGLLKVLGAKPGSPAVKFSLDTLESLAPYTFILAITATVAILLVPLTWEFFGFQNRNWIVIVAVSLFFVSFLLLWLIRAREFTMHRVHRAKIIRNYLAPAAASEPETNPRDIDVDLSATSSTNDGPYPLFGAALDIAELAPDYSAQVRTVPFLFSPLFSGYELTRNVKTGASDAYRRTEQLGGGVSLATAVAISQPIRSKSFRPPSGPTSMLWTTFNMRDGRFIGNPIRETWRERGPLIEPLYALREADLATEIPFVRPSPSEDFDYLGIYQLVKRQCRFIIACDATNDPDFSFDDLGKTILRCRTELGVDIEMDLGPIGRMPAAAGAHYQVAQIKYGSGPDGFMVYIKPSLTGDEPTGLVQHARVHPEFPAMDVAEGRFSESDFESYRALGLHIVDTILADTKITAEMLTSEVVLELRRELQPDFVETEPSEIAETAATSVIPQELIDAIASGECVLCTGSGLAAQAKLPTWTALLDGLLRTAREQRVLDAATATGLAATLAAGEFEAAADDLAHQIPRELLVDHIRAVSEGAAPSRSHEILAQMKFLGALNLSVDDLVAKAFQAPVLVPSQAARLVQTLQAKQFFAVNLFGSPTQPPSLLVTMKEFRQLLLANTQLKQFLGTLLLRYNMIFLGLGMDTLRGFMDALELPQTPERKHYAILPNATQIDPVKIRFFERSYNICIVDYQPQFNFSGLETFLEKLQMSVRDNAPESKRSQPLTLKSLKLENIGPFYSQEVQFTPQWNLILGDNGVGKTVLLKAIAAALCGDRADPQAVARLLRVGASKGSIRLKDENREYVVELERTNEGVKVASASLSPIIYERWLVLGFPALRSIPLERPKGPSPLKREAPRPEDLLPLLRGEPDGRIADIKQWLINLDWAAPKEPSPSRSRIVYNEFFSVLQRLIPDVRIGPGPIDPKTMEISVVTDNGSKVPLEAVSQGTGSVMCWIGTLLERLSETGKRRDSEQNCALVLIDELDAHMHPKWQRMFVDAFRKEFQSVQIIATTHSPLLVGSLTPEEIWSVHRSPLISEIDGVFHSENVTNGMREIVILGAEEKGQPGKRKERRYLLPAKTKLLVNEGDVVEEGEPLTEENVRVNAEKVDMSTEGWRADQILTSPLFELETTRDPETAKLIEKYTKLTALQKRSEQQERELARVAGELHIRVPNAHETEAAREAFDLIKRFATQSLKELEPEKQQAVLNEVKVQLTESITGSGRVE